MTGWHRHVYQSGPLVIRAEHCHEDMPPSVPCTPVILLDPVTARDIIARALYAHMWEGSGMPTDEAECCADVVIAALASQERGE